MARPSIIYRLSVGLAGHAAPLAARFDKRPLIIARCSGTADVVAALKVKLLPTQELPKAPRTNNPEAYQQYLQGRYYLNRFSIADLEKARAALMQRANFAVDVVG